MNRIFTRLRGLLLLLGVFTRGFFSVNAKQQVPCWSGTFANLKSVCCDMNKGPFGEVSCWSGVFTFDRCCSEEVSPDQLVNAKKLSSYVNSHLLEDLIEINAAHNLVDKVRRVRDDGHEEVSKVDRSEYIKSRIHFDFRSQVDKSDVRIYVHPLPECAGPKSVDVLYEDFPPTGAWTLYVRQHLEQILAIDEGIMRSGHLVSDPSKATVFYVRAFWSALVELDLRYDDSTDFMLHYQGVRCISEVFDHLRKDPYYMRNAAYDHFFVAGIHHPVNPIDQSRFHIEKYDPFADNMMIMVASQRDYGFADRLFTNEVSLYANLKFIWSPFPSKLDCRRLERFGQDRTKRDVAVAFVGSILSRVRSWVEELSKLPEISSDPRFHFSFGDTVDIRSSMSNQGSELYANVDFCLIMPGHMHDLTKRAYDAMARACLPVIATATRFWMSVPFASQVKWTSFATFKRLSTKADMRALLNELLNLHEENQPLIQQRRQAMLKESLGLFPVQDEENCTADEKAVFPRLLIKELEARQKVWPHMRATWFMED